VGRGGAEAGALLGMAEGISFSLSSETRSGHMSS